MAAVVNRGDGAVATTGPDAWQLREAPAGFVRPANSHDLSIKLIKSEIEADELIKHVAEERTCEI